MLTSLKKSLTVRNLTADMVWTHLYKTVYQKTRPANREDVRVFPIFGCQRSGTSLMTRIFFRDVDAKVYRESSSLSSSDPDRLRLDSLADIRKRIDGERARLIVLKPLVESQNALRFLDVFPEAKGLWLYRHYKDVAASNLKAFGMENGINDLRPIVEREPHDWRSEGASEETMAVVADHFSESMDPYDAAALFWYARNRLYFELELAENPRILLCNYDNLVTEPATVMRQIYAFLDLPYPGDHIVSEVHASSVKKGEQISVSPTVDDICADMFAQLNSLSAPIPA